MVPHVGRETGRKEFLWQERNILNLLQRDILKSSVKGAFQKLDPRYMIKNPVMFVVEVGFFITLLLSIFPSMFGDGGELRIYNTIVTLILFVTILFANFAESVAEGRGKAQAETLKKDEKGIPLPGFWIRQGMKR